MHASFASRVPWLLLTAALAIPGCSAGESQGPGWGPGLGGDDAGEEGDCITPDGDSCEIPVCSDPCGYNDPAYESGECRIVEYTAECNDERGIKITFQKSGASVPPPNAFFRGEDGNLQKWIEQRWNEMADFTIPASVKTKIENNPGNVQIHNYPEGNDWTRTDFHGAIMALPPGHRPENLLRSLLNDPIKATGNNKFAGWVGWPVSNDRQVGDVIDLDIYGPDNGAVGYWKIDQDRFCVVTVENDSAGWHPVNGIRCWGYVPIQVNPNWKKTSNRWNCGQPTYLFYTMGIDSPSVPGGGTFGGVAAQRSTWNALMKDLSVENQKKGGVSGRWMLQKTIGQPNALKPGGATNVTAPGELEGYYVSLPKDNFRNGEVCEAPDLSCGADQFTCSDASCISLDRRCDGTSDCLDGDDEQSCDGSDGSDGGAGSCAGNQFACGDGECIPENWRCDGEYTDCAGGEDEQGCDDASEPTGCAAGEFTCNDGECIPGAWRCDGEYTDCAGGEDEDECGGNDEPPAGGDSCGAGEWACNDGQCIPESWKCDDYNDCAGNEDEQGCDAGDGGDGGGQSCGAGEWTCSDGACIPEDWRCDGAYVDCAGGEDEQGCDAGDGGGGGNSCNADEWACNDGQCIPADWQCDVYVDCAGGEDEMGC